MPAKKKKKKTVKPTTRFQEFLRSSRFAKLRGAVYVMFAAFLMVAMIGYYTTDGGHNGRWLGLVGTAVASFFANHLFGVASFGFVLLFFVYGLRLHKVYIMPWWRTFGAVVFWMFWLSTTLGYVGGQWVKNTDFESVAGIGLVIAGQLAKWLSWWTLILMLFIGGLFLVLYHRVKVKLPELDLPKIEVKKAENLIREAVTDHTPEPVATDVPVLLNDQEDEPVDEHNDELNPIFKKSGKNSDEPAEEVQLSIDEEFEQIVKKAMGSQKEEPESAAEPEFTIENTGLSEGSVVNPASAEPEIEDTEDYSRHFTIDDVYDPHLDLKQFQMPSTDMLEDWEARNTKVTNEELVANKDRIVKTLRDYGIEVVGISATPGPTVTLYEIKPAPGIRISKIKNLEDDIALSLSALGIRIIAPIPGRGTVGIEVPNANPQVVAMKTMLECDAFVKSGKMELPIAIGKTISNEPYVTDLAKMPHLLMAGATGTGKSVGLNAVIASLLFKKHPSELKFVMVDPKKVELSLYSKIERHYLAKLPDSEEAIITDVKKVVRTLNSLCIEMDQRYDLLKQAQVRKITEYNDKFCHRRLNPENGHHYMPYIVLVIDEFADLIMTAGKEVEMPIARLAQLARAVGIHLIIATQRPTTNIITGTIKANFPARIAFRVTSGIDSRTILDAGGAQQLIGRGDMLISLAGSDMVRLQCALIETEEIERLADWIGGQRGYPDGFLLPEYLDENEEPNKEFDPKQKDEFFNDAARLVVASQFGSTSLLQRKLQLGYNRAGRIIDQLEAAGIVGPYNGSKPRDVLVHDEQTLEDLLREL
ncbi:MAG: DNA translocase FtsK [Bacteroidales bacterium]|nr:DNA translocase FtsK [Bacteroidales bacterium]